jgi:hypothetical protein
MSRRLRVFESGFYRSKLGHQDGVQIRVQDLIHELPWGGVTPGTRQLTSVFLLYLDEQWWELIERPVGLVARRRTE